jgi:hypothetical protein
MLAPSFAPGRVREIGVTASMDDQEAKKLRGFRPEPSWYDTVLAMDGDSQRGLRPDGSTLFVVLRGALSAGSLGTAWAGLKDFDAPPLNRGAAAGRDGAGRTLKGYPVSKRGTRSQTNMIPLHVIKHLRVGHSGVVGALDRDDRYPYCRFSSTNGKQHRRLTAVIPLAREVEQLMAYAVPDRWAAQREIANRTCPQWLVGGTCFSTITVNRNFQCGTHQDDGDYKPGFSNLVMIRSGRFTGGHLVLPKYRVAIELNTGDALFFDPHEWHGTSPYEGLHKRFERMTLVLYYRTKMAECGTPAEERQRGAAVAKQADFGWGE